ncbi:MAG: FkbM family methyltransferase [Bacteroidota bacterium]
MTNHFLLNIRTRLGLLRSLAIYYGKPFNRRRLKQFYASFVKTGDLCFDLGAHLGNRSDAFLRLGATVIAVEPQPSCTQFLRFWFGKNARFTLVEQAVGAKAGTLPLHISSLTPTVTTLADQDWQQIIDEDTSFKVRWDQTLQVPITTLDALIATYGLPDFTKFDIENYEWEALQGLSQALPCLSFEYYPATISRAVDCIHYLDQLGDYEWNWSFGESQQLNEREWLATKAIVVELQQIERGGLYGDVYGRVREGGEQVGSS